MKDKDLFPKTKFVNEYVKKYGLEKAISKQLTTVSSELFEVQDASSRQDYRHALEQLAYMIPNGKKMYSSMREEVIEKNRLRGYYENK